jgi:hypothetical protein
MKGGRICHLCCVTHDNCWQAELDNSKDKEDIAWLNVNEIDGLKEICV